MDFQLRRYYLSAAGILALATAASLLSGNAAVTLGVASGVLVSAVPFVSWHIIVAGSGTGGASRRALVLGAVLVKYAVVAAVIWALFRWKLVHETAFAAGVVTGSLAVFGIVLGGAKR